MYMDPDIITITEEKRLSWLGHVQGTRLKAALMGMPTEERPLGIGLDKGGRTKLTRVKLDDESRWQKTGVRGRD